MKEWDVVIVIISLVGLFTSVYRPMSGNTKAMTELNITMRILSDNLDKLDSRMENLEVKNHESHMRLWLHNEEQDDKLSDHETRIQFLEKREEKV